jgi:hypothetical protein
MIKCGIAESGCGVAHLGVAYILGVWIRLVGCDSLVGVWRSSVGCGVAQWGMA